MPINIVFISDFGDDCIEVSDRLPKDRPSRILKGVWQGYKLIRLRIEAEFPPILPEGDLTQKGYREWRATLDSDSVREEPLDRMTVAAGLGGVCVDVKLAAVDYEVIGTVLNVTVTNVGPYPAGKIQVAWHGEWEPKDNNPLIGQGFHLAAYGTSPKELFPGQSRIFVLPKPQLRQALSYAAAFPPEQYHLKINATAPRQEAYYEISRVSGAELSYMIERLEEFLETEAPL
jgi:hypothetical protein